MTEVHSCGSPPFSTCLGAVASFIISQGQKCHKKPFPLNGTMKPTDKIFCNTFGTHFQMYYKMRILPVIFLFSMMTKAQDNFILGFLIHGVNLILNKGMTGIWIARRYWLFFYIEEPIYPSVYHVFGGGARLFLTIFFFHC